MPRLTETQKTFIVQSLATFRTGAEVIALVKEAFGVELSRQHVHYYDPTAPASKTPKKWRVIHDATREAWLEASAEEGIAQPRYRLRELQELYERMKKAGNVTLAASLLEQAAKETGGAFTNHRILAGPGGKPLPSNIAVTFVDAPGPEGAGGAD